MDKKRVLLVLRTPLGISGVPLVIMHIVRELSHKITFDLLSLSLEKGELEGEFESLGGKIYRCNTFNYAEHRLLYPYRTVQIKRALENLLKTEKYDVIHCHCGADSGICTYVARKFGIGVRIAHSHGIDPLSRNPLRKFFYSLCKKALLKNATQLLACSDSAGEALFLGRPFHNVLNPVDTEYYRNIEKRVHDGVILVQIGYFCHGKNQLFSLKLLSRLRELGMSASLTFIGYEEEKGYEQRMRDSIAQYGISDFVSVRPRDTDKREVFSFTDYCLLPSVNEGLPLVALESQAAGVTCLMSDRISKDADVGGALFLPHDDVDAWANAIALHVTPKKHVNVNDISLKGYSEKIESFYNV